MKNIFEIKKGLVALFICLACFSCSDNSELGLPAKDGTPPAQPEVVKIHNTNGGAIIYYKVPGDKDLAYVSATYVINGQRYTTKSSVHVDSLQVQGFGKEGDYSIELRSVDFSRNESAPLEVKVSPMKSPIGLVFETVRVETSFGGVRVSWKNPTEANLIVGVFYKDEIGNWVSMENFYSSAKEDTRSVRGLDTTPKTFGINIRDRWDNYSEMATSEHTPFFEEVIKSEKFRALQTRLPDDCTPHGSGPLPNLWDGDPSLAKAFFSNNDGYLNPFVTFDMGQTAKLSRFRLWHLTLGGWLYNQSNLKTYDVYGCNEITAEMTQGAGLKGWTLLCEAICYKPSGEGPVTNEDTEYINQGDEHEVLLDAPAVRYIRIHMKEPWMEGTGQRAIGDIKFWGEVQK